MSSRARGWGLEGNPPSELTVHISNTWSVKSLTTVVLLKEKKKLLFFGKCKNSFTSCIPIYSVWQFRRGGSWNGSCSGYSECSPAARDEPTK